MLTNPPVHLWLLRQCLNSKFYVLCDCENWWIGRSSTFNSSYQGKLTVRKPSVLSISSAASSQGQPPSSWYEYGDCACSASNIINMTNLVPDYSVIVISLDFIVPTNVHNVIYLRPQRHYLISRLISSYEEDMTWSGFGPWPVAGIICNRITCGCGSPHSCYHQNITWMCICRVYTYN